MPGPLDNAHSFTVSILSLGRGLLAGSGTRIPEKPLELYEFEACPYCRKVREVLSEMDLSYVSHPCGRGSNQRQTVIALGGKTLFPFLVDPNTGRSMYESEDIITYLMETYGRGRSGWSRGVSGFHTATAKVGSAARPLRGRVTREGARDRKQPPKRLELFNFEASPYCRKAREALCELNLEYACHNVAKGGRRRQELVERGGKMQVPYLIDPNTGTEMYESDDIVAYLTAQYGGETRPEENQRGGA